MSDACVYVDSIEGHDDFGIGELFPFTKLNLETATIRNEYQSVVVRLMRDARGKVYEVLWTKKENVDIHELNNLDGFADWNKPHSVRLM